MGFGREWTPVHSVRFNFIFSILYPDRTGARSLQKKKVISKESSTEKSDRNFTQISLPRNRDRNDKTSFYEIIAA